MVKINEFESKILQDRYNQQSNQSNSTQEEAYPPITGEDCHLLFPEIASDTNNTAENSSNAVSVSPQDENLFEIVDDDVVISPLLSSVEYSGHQKSFSLVSDASSEDVIVLKVESENNIQETENSYVKELTLPPNPNRTLLLNSPPVQVMERNGGYDPNRIPSSVFSTNDSTGVGDWSAASNESLFSIHIGNTSFDREHALSLSGELKAALTGVSKSGELEDKSGNSLECLNSSEGLVVSGPSPPAIEQVVVKDGQDVIANGKNDGKKEMKVDLKNETLKEVPIRSEKERPQCQQPCIRSSSVSHQSDASEESSGSFAFPILSEVADKFNPNKKVNHPHHLEQHEEERYSVIKTPPLPPPPPQQPPQQQPITIATPHRRRSFFSRCSCLSCSSCYNCFHSFTHCCSNCYTCKSCCPTSRSCKSCWRKLFSCKCC